MPIEPTARDRMLDKLLAIESWAYKLRHAITSDSVAGVPPETPHAIVARACKEIQHLFYELREIVK